MRIPAALLGLALTSGTAAAAEPLVWQGDLFITAVTSACTTASVAAVGDFDEAVYRPKLTASAPADALALTLARASLILVANSGTLKGSVAYTGTFIGSHADLGQYTSTVKLAIASTSGGSVTSSSRGVAISGTINEYFSIPGCTITVTGVLGPRPT